MSQVTFSDVEDLTEQNIEVLLDWYYNQRYIVHRNLDERYSLIIQEDCDMIKNEIIKRCK